MFLSMTGFGSSSQEFSWGTVIVEITSVNHKYQDFSARLPRELSSLENRIINLLRSSITRGKVKLSAEIAWNPGARIPALDEEGLMNLLNQVRRIAKRSHMEAPKDITNLLLIPGVYDENNNLAEQAAHATRLGDESCKFIDGHEEIRRPQAQSKGRGRFEHARKAHSIPQRTLDSRQR